MADAYRRFLRRALILRVEYEVRPEPTPEELEVLRLALKEGGAAAPTAYRSAWREAALGEPEDE